MLLWGVNSTVDASGGVAIGVNATVQATDGVAIGHGAQVVTGATNSIALGAGSIADEENVVSVGAPGRERRIMNVAPPIYDTDAANKAYVDSVGQATLKLLTRIRMIK